MGNSKPCVFINLRQGIKKEDAKLKPVFELLQKNQFETVFADGKTNEKRTYNFALSFGGDGTFLETAELLKNTLTPIFGINFGHVGFLTDANEKDALSCVEKLINNSFKVEKRSIICGRIINEDIIKEFWAINEVAIEKANENGKRNGMINVRVEVDNRPFSAYGCDGLLVSTPTGSTAHSFSAGGPVVSPEVNAMILVPLAPHTPFSRPVVFGSSSELRVILDESPSEFATLICDGRRSFELEKGAIIEIHGQSDGICLAKLDDSNKKPFTEKLVEKFKLPVESWKNA